MLVVLLVLGPPAVVVVRLVVRMNVVLYVFLLVDEPLLPVAQYVRYAVVLNVPYVVVVLLVVLYTVVVLREVLNASE